MSLSIVANLTDAATAGLCLDAAASAAAVSPDTQIEAFYPHLAPESFILPSEEVMTERRQAELAAMLDRHSQAIREAVESWNAAAAGRSAAWHDAQGRSLGEAVAARGRGADLIVLVRTANDEGEAALHAAIFETGKPLLLVPPGGPAAFGHHLAIAWKASDQASRAVAAAMPWLKRAKKVSVLTAGRSDGSHDAEGAIALLADHGIKPDALELERGAGSVAELLLDNAHRIGADGLVLGAYRHSELREWLLGGVTRHMLQHADLPLFMVH